MKKTLAIIISLIITTNIFGQSEAWHNSDGKHNSKTVKLPNYKMGLGLDFSYPYASLSAKFKVSSNSILQVIASPFGTSNYGISKYCGRYNYIIPNSSVHLLENTSDYFYGFGEIGLLTWHYDYYYDSKRYSIFTYAVGAGYETIFSNKFGVNAQLAYGLYSVWGSTYGYSLTGGVGVHYYFSKGRTTASSPTNNAAKETTTNDDDEKSSADDEKEESKKEITKPKEKEKNKVKAQKKKVDEQFSDNDSDTISEIDSPDTTQSTYEPMFSLHFFAGGSASISKGKFVDDRKQYYGVSAPNTTFSGKISPVYFLSTGIQALILPFTKQESALKNVKISAGAVYSKQGFISRYEANYKDPSIDYRDVTKYSEYYNLHYLSIPISVRYGRKFYGEAGVTINKLIGGDLNKKVEKNISGTQANGVGNNSETAKYSLTDSLVNKSNTGFVLGIGYDISKRISIRLETYFSGKIFKGSDHNFKTVTPALQIIFPFAKF